MPPLDLAALQFWNAAKFHRRAPGRDQTNARKVLIQLSASGPANIRERAITILKEIASHDQPARNG